MIETLPGCSMLPPMNPDPDHRPPSHQGASRAKGHPHDRNAGDRFGVANAFVDFGARLVDPTAQSCWWTLWRETKPDGLARVSFSRVAECVGMDRRTAIRAIDRLAKAGLLTVVRRGGMRSGASTYRAHGTPKGTKT